MYAKQLIGVLFTFFSLALLGQEVLPPEKISKLTPDRIKGYYQDGDTRSSLIKLGNIRYSLVERRFSKGKEKIKVLLFDYKEADIMYKQAMRKWNHEPVVTDSLVLRTIEMEDCTGWESYNRQSYTSQIFLGICNRFFLMISAENVPLDKLKEILDSFSFRDFPK
jgi:hypothetical protein